MINTPYDFNFHSFETGSVKEFQSTSVISFWLENENILWVGTDGGGLKRVNRQNNNIITFQPVSNDNYFFPDKVVMSIYRDYKGLLWMGTYLEGLIRFNPKTYAFTQYKNEPENPKSLSHNFVSTILEDTRGNLWIGTNGGGLNLFDEKSQTFLRFTNQPDNNETTLISDYVSVIEEDFNGDLWVGTYWGLSKLDIRDFTFTNYIHSDTKSKTVERVNLNNNVIYSLLSDSKGRLWIGTRMGLHPARNPHRLSDCRC